MATDVPQENKSALRSSIAKYGSNSYYYAHAPLPAAGDDAKKIEGPGIVTGGPPTLLSCGVAAREPIVAAADAAAEAAAGRKVIGGISLTRYTWCDYTKCVKVYIHLNNIREGEELDGPFNSNQIATEFNNDRMAIAIQRPSGLYILSMIKTYGEIIPEESSVNISDHKISISLQKKDELTWFSLTR